MEKKKLKLEHLNVDSFLTELTAADKKTVDGGTVLSAVGEVSLLFSLLSAIGEAPVVGTKIGIFLSDIICPNANASNNGSCVSCAHAGCEVSKRVNCASYVG